MLDDLRRSAVNTEFEEEEEDLAVEEDFEGVSTRSTLFLGMTAVERMILAILLFLLVSVVGFGLLLATNRIVF